MEYLLLAMIVYILFIMYIEISDSSHTDFPSYDGVLFIRLLPHIFGICSLILNIVLLSII